MASDGNVFQRLGEYVVENRRGMVGDLVFAVVWVTLVNLFFRVVDGPTWAYYMFMAAGIVAYFGFVFSVEAAAQADERR
jgi:hypothetical protein